MIGSGSMLSMMSAGVRNIFGGRAKSYENEHVWRSLIPQVRQPKRKNGLTEADL